MRRDGCDSAGHAASFARRGYFDVNVSIEERDLRIGDLIAAGGAQPARIHLDDGLSPST
jgi:hypothetical protein